MRQTLATGASWHLKVRCAKTVKYTPDFKDWGVGGEGGQEGSIPLIIFMLITWNDNIFVILGSINYILKINFTYLFLVSFYF